MTEKWNVYPRPQLVRKDWECLNGQWKIKWDGLEEALKINVPFCPESKLSGIPAQLEQLAQLSGLAAQVIPSGKPLSYERTLRVPAEWRQANKRVILHFGAVDQEAVVYINNIKVGEHKGGYLPFSCDITEALNEDSNLVENLRVEVTDALDHRYPWGKQKQDRGGMWYTPVSGIWKTVWMECVPTQHIQLLKIDTGLEWVEIRAYGVESGTIELLGEKHELIKDEAAGTPCASIHIDIRRPHLWTPEDPFLYSFTIKAGDDDIWSYFALRTLEIAECDGYPRLCLNGQPYFFNGVLDQGYWQDGIYTPESPEAFAHDILEMKKLGFNTLRKHIKIEHEQFYFECDRLGMVVFQDMVNNSDYSFFHDTALPTIGIKHLKDTKWHADHESRAIFLNSMNETVRLLYNHPSICYWTIFNEGWGQFCADEAYDKLRELDSTRFIDSTSGWFHQNKSDVDSHHIYFKKLNAKAGRRPLVLSEFGGYACKLADHCFNPDKTYGYKKCADEAALLKDLAALYDNEVAPLMKQGLSAAIYTQLSDVEDETNGFLTYDREIAKFKPYSATGRIEIIGNHTDHQGGHVLVCPSKEKMKAFVADNHSDVLRVNSEGFGAIELDLSKKNDYEPETTRSIVVGIVEAFAERFGDYNYIMDLYARDDDRYVTKAGDAGVSDANASDKTTPLEPCHRGFDCYIKSEIPVGSGLSSSSAFGVLVANIINEKIYDNRADAVQIAQIASDAERDYYGKPGGLQDQMAISIGKLMMIDFAGKEPEFETIDFDLDSINYKMKIVMTESDHEGLNDEYASIPNDMFAVAAAMGIEKLGDSNKGRFENLLPELEKKVEAGELTQLQLDRARHFYDETERVLMGATALQAGNVEKFIYCVNESGLSSENLLKNVLPEGVETSTFAETLSELRADPRNAAVKLEGGGFGGSILVFQK